MHHHSRIVPYFTPVLLLIMIAGRCLADDSLKTRFLNEAPQAWTALDDFGRELEGTFIVLQTRTDKPTYNKKLHADFAIHGKTCRLHFVRGDRETVQAMNSDYYFAIDRDKGVQDYAIKVLEPNGKGGKEMTMEAAKTINESLNDVFAPWFFNGQPLKEAIADPRFILKTVEPVSSRGKELVRVRFDWKPLKGEDEHQYLTDCWLILDPAEYWSLQEYEFGVFWGGRVHAILEYGAKIDGFPGLHQKKMRTYSSAKSKEGEGIFRVLSFERLVHHSTAPVDNEFRLSGYGLPEPTFGAPGRGSGKWYLLLGLVCATLTVVLRASYKRRSAAAGPSS